MNHPGTTISSSPPFRRTVRFEPRGSSSPTANESFVPSSIARVTVAAGTASRDYAPSGRYAPLTIDDATSIVSVKIDDDLDYSFGETLVDNVDWQAEPLNGRAAGQDWPFTRLRPLEDGYWPMGRHGRATVRVEATYGWPAIPNAVKQATILQASRMFTRYDSPLGVAGFGEMGAMRVSFRVDPDVGQLLEPFVRVTL